MPLTDSQSNHRCSNVSAIIDVGAEPELRADVPDFAKGNDRSDTYMQITVCPGNIELVGTIDNLSDFANNLYFAIINWLIQNGKQDWIGATVQAEQTERVSSDGHTDNP